MADDKSIIGSPGGFLSRPEGKVGVILPLAAGGAILFFFGSAIGGFIVNAVDNILHLTIVGGVLLAILFMACDPKLRAAVFYLYRSILRYSLSFFVNNDPVGIRMTYVAQAKEAKAKVDEDMGKLRGQRIDTQKAYDENENDLRQHRNELVLGRERKYEESTLIVFSRQIDRDEILQKKYAESIAVYDKLLTEGTRYQRKCSEVLMDLESDIKFRKKDLALSKSTHSVISNMRALLKGLPAKEMYDEAGDVLDARYSGALGEVADFSETMKDLLAFSDLHDSAALNAALAKIDAAKQPAQIVAAKEPPVTK